MAAKPALSFGFAKKADPKRVVASLAAANKKSEPVREVITAVDAGEVTLSAPREQPHLLTIPCRNPLDLGKKPQASLEANAAAAARKQPTTEESMPGGLITRSNLAQLSSEDAEAARELLGDAAKGPDEVAAAPAVPILMRAGSKKARDAGSDGSAPEATRDMFDRVSVESFGEAMLRGMGYDPQEHATKPVIHSTIRDSNLGLGAKVLLPHEKAIIKGKAAKGAGKRPRVAEPTPAPTAEGVAANGDDAPEPKQQRTDSVEAVGDAPSTVESDFWPSRGLVVRVVSKAGQLADVYLATGVVLEADPTSGRCRIKARDANDVSRVLEGVAVADIETRVSREDTRVRFVRGDRRGVVAKLVRRDAKMRLAVVRVDGDATDTEVPLDDVCGFMK